MSASFDLPQPDRVIVGTVGVPGQRTFYLQARQGERLATLKLEKQQVAALAQLVGELLADVPATAPEPVDAGMDLEEPVLAEWAVGTMQLAYDAGADRIVLLAEELLVEPDPDAEPTSDEGAIARVSMSRQQATALVSRAETLVTAGRPPCPLCGHPLDPEGHSCPRTNGHRPPAL